jgi:hypothetical protein
MIGVRPIDDPFVTVYFDRWHRHHLVQALCDSMRELTVGVLRGWAKLNLFFDSKWWQKDYQLPSTSINCHQLPSTSVNLKVQDHVWVWESGLPTTPRRSSEGSSTTWSMRTVWKGRHSRAPSRWRIGMNWSNMMHIDGLTGI